MLAASHAPTEAPFAFPQMAVRVVGDKGTATLGEDYEMRVAALGEPPRVWRAAPAVEPWMVPQFAAIQGSVVNIQRHFLDQVFNAQSAASKYEQLRASGQLQRLADEGELAEQVGAALGGVATSGADNLKSQALVQAAYESASTGMPVRLREPWREEDKAKFVEDTSRAAAP